MEIPNKNNPNLIHNNILQFLNPLGKNNTHPKPTLHHKIFTLGFDPIRLTTRFGLRLR